jgi:hypothetical protein
MATDLLAKLVPRAPRRLLEELVERGQRAAATGKDRPLVTVLLAAGRDIVGRVVALRDDGGIAVCALHIGGSPAAPQVAHIRVDQIAAITYDMVGDRPPLADEPAPGRLELARALSERTASIAARLGATLSIAVHEPLGEDDRRAVMAAIPTLEQVIGKLADDAIGKDALRTLTAVRLGASVRGGVRKDGTTLTIEVPRGAEDTWDEASMRAAVEKAL